jgi:glutamyl-tRNA synthetase
MEYERLGYLPEAMVNFLALLGWSPGGGDQEVFTRDELKARFALEGISGGNAVFNSEKLDWFNQQHIGRLDASELSRRVEPMLRAARLWRDDLAGASRDWWLRVLELLRPRAKKFEQIVEEARPFLDEQPARDEAAAAKHLGKADLRAPLEELASSVLALKPFAQQEIENALRQAAERHGVKAAAVIHATRVAVTGKSVSPGLFEVLELLGPERTAARLRAAVRVLPG